MYVNFLLNFSNCCLYVCNSSSMNMRDRERERGWRRESERGGGGEKGV